MCIYKLQNKETGQFYNGSLYKPDDWQGKSYPFRWHAERAMVHLGRYQLAERYTIMAFMV